MREQTKIQVDKDKVRMMVADLGYAETAQRLNIMPATLRQWAKRGKWSVTPVHAQAVTSVTRPIAEAHAEALAELKGKTKLSLAKSAARMAEDAENATLRYSGNVHKVAQTYALVHEIGADKGRDANVVVNIALLGVEPSEVQATARELDSGVSE